MRQFDHIRMRLAPQSAEGWGRFGLIALGTLVLGLTVFFTRFRNAYAVWFTFGEWPQVVFVLSTATLGIYSAALLWRRRIVLAVIGFVIFAVGAYHSLPTLAAK